MPSIQSIIVDQLSKKRSALILSREQLLTNQEKLDVLNCKTIVLNDQNKVQHQDYSMLLVNHLTNILLS